jgi:glycosyltransferase involved in cell wall biosynthesis
VVIDTPIDPLPKVEKTFDKIRLVYSSTPQRGLELLVPVFVELAKKYDNIHLDVFSSFKIYGWDDADKRYEHVYDIIRNHPQMTYHGFAPNDVVKEHLLKAHIHAYPSIWLECNSRSIIEAMSAGLLCVHPNFGGLSDTSGGLNFMYQGDNNHQTHANVFYHALEHAINKVSTEELQNYLRLVKLYADSRYAWSKIVGQWTDTILELKDQYKDVSLRKPKGEILIYNTI